MAQTYVFESIKVRMEHGRFFYCEVEVPQYTSSCKYCGADILWGTTAKGKFVPLQPDIDSDLSTDSHFTHCDRHPLSGKGKSSRRRAPGRKKTPPPPLPPKTDELTKEMWRKMMSLMHPDRHHGEDSEATANEVTRWLLGHRPDKESKK